MIKEKVNPSTEDDRDPNVRTTRSRRVSRPTTKKSDYFPTSFSCILNKHTVMKNSPLIRRK
jgi:hypothetical protein